MEFDVIVVGSGAAGLTGAVTCALSGLKVLVLESTSLLGGTTAYSAGGAWIPDNHHMKAAGLQDSLDSARSYLKSVLGDYYDSKKIEAFLINAPKMLTYLESEGAVRFSPTTIPDYAPGSPGWNRGRCLLPVEYHARFLGRDFERLRPPIPEMGLFGSMQVSSFDAYQLQRWKESWGNFTFALKRFGGYFFNRLLGKRGRHISNGNALVARLLKAATDRGVTLWESARATRLILTDRRVSGVAVTRNGKEELISARRGVLLASGGFGANAAMRRQYVPMADAGWSLQPEGCQGDGIKMGVEAGGVLNEGNVANGIWVPASSTKRADGSIAKFPSLAFDRHCPGSIMIDARTGRRFFNESFHYQAFGQTVHRQGIEKIWMISDARAVSKYGIGMVKPAPFSPAPWVKQGYVIQADSVRSLADKIGVDPQVLSETVATFNGYAQSGRDLDFQRGEDDYSSFMGDASHKPNPTLGALETGPFYALELRPCDLSTMAGLNIDEQSRVVRKDGSAIEGLYAAGLDSNSLMRGLYPGGGSSIGPAMTFAYIAARGLTTSTKTTARASAA
jgi:succinate dehydrogenase/fumarate reductase flavoprotein subunit